MDLWSVGCVMFEIITLYPLFPATSNLDMLHRIHKIIGTPTLECLAKFRTNGSDFLFFKFPPQDGIDLSELLPEEISTVECVDLLKKLLTYDPEYRISARDALQHSYFEELKIPRAARQAAEIATAQNSPAHAAPVN